MLHPNSIAAMRQAIEMAGILFLFRKTGEAAGIVRRTDDDDPHALVFDRKGNHAGILRPCWGG